MKKFRKYFLILSSTCLLTINTSFCFANPQIPSINTKIDMSRGSDAQKITPVIAINLPEEKVNTKIDMSCGSDAQKITPVIATNLSKEKVNTKIDMSHGSDAQKITPVIAKYIE